MLQTAVSQQPDYLPALYDLGLIYDHLGETAVAREMFSQIITLAPGSDWAAQAQTQLEQNQ